MKVLKTTKLYIGGAFPRTESGRSFKTYFHKSDKVYAHLCLSSRKDFRTAVDVAKAAQEQWDKRTAYNRSQILYRMAEMLEGKREEFVTLFKDILGWEHDKGNEEVSKAIDAFVYYSGFCDKYQQLSSSINPINGPYGNSTGAEAVGLVTLLCENAFDFERLVAQICSIIVGGNSVIAILDSNHECPALLAPLAEVFATSDLPPGVVNILTGDYKELLENISSHREVKALSFQNESKELKTLCQKNSIDNLKRFIGPRKEHLSLEAIVDTLEFKTIWQPVGF